MGVCFLLPTAELAENEQAADPRVPLMRNAKEKKANAIAFFVV
jgi:hypothetical protein